MESAVLPDLVEKEDLRVPPDLPAQGDPADQVVNQENRVNKAKEDPLGPEDLVDL